MTKQKAETHGFGTLHSRLLITHLQCVYLTAMLFSKREKGEKSISHSHKKAVLFQKTSNFDGKGVREVREMGCHCA